MTMDTWRFRTWLIVLGFYAVLFAVLFSYCAYLVDRSPTGVQETFFYQVQDAWKIVLGAFLGALSVGLQTAFPNASRPSHSGGPPYIPPAANQPPQLPQGE